MIEKVKLIEIEDKAGGPEELMNMLSQEDLVTYLLAKGIEFGSSNIEKEVDTLEELQDALKRENIQWDELNEVTQYNLQGLL